MKWVCDSCSAVIYGADPLEHDEDIEQHLGMHDAEDEEQSNEEGPHLLAQAGAETPKGSDMEQGTRAALGRLRVEFSGDAIAWQRAQRLARRNRSLPVTTVEEVRSRRAARRRRVEARSAWSQVVA